MTTHDYDRLTPDTIIQAVEHLGLAADARLLSLNSYENRVIQVGIEDELPIIAKFYRPNRWSDDQILEEHQFTQRLVDAELSVIAPLRINDTSLFEYSGFRFALYPRQGGHAPILEESSHLKSIGRLLGRMHAIGKAHPFQHRAHINVHSLGQESVDFLVDNQWIPDNLLPAYTSLVNDLLARCHNTMADVDPEYIALQGDCHPGNILWREDRAYLIDFDDARMGPAVSDLWMLLSGDEHQQRQQLEDMLDGYREFCDFNYRETLLIESLRSLRIIHYSAWLARRWEDPSFPKSFPWFNTERYWSDHILSLREQLGQF